MRIPISLRCTKCKNRNYYTSKNKNNTSEKVVIKKFCKYCRNHTEHKEDKIK